MPAGTTSIRTHRLIRLTILVGMFSFILGALTQPPRPSRADPPAPPPALQEEIIVGIDHNGGTITVGETQILTVRLPVNPSTGYLWQAERTEDSGQLGERPILRQVGETVFSSLPDLLPDPPYSPLILVGAPVLQKLQFQPLSEGETTLRLAHRRPWEDAAPLGDAFTLTVQTVGSFLNHPAPLDGADEATPPPLLGPQPDLGLPSKFNWCDNGGCTPVKNQGSCGSCWAFATVGVQENLIKIRDGVERDLSEQYHVSCNTDGWSCNGGWQTHEYHVDAYGANQTQPGAVYEADFPYQAKDLACPLPPLASHEQAEQWTYVAADPRTVPSVAALKQAIYEHGPVFVAVRVCNWGSYQGGVYETSCSGQVNHAVVLVGWDDTQGTNGVWYLRNSWGTGWGEDGSMRIGYGVSSVGYAASYVVYHEGSNTLLPPNEPHCDPVRQNGESDLARQQHHRNRVPR
ncbi:MAG: hypothetical protein HC884_19550 [Chloroflexaceae bacterium]|nr:hypothetical protein [Chloroflexaceae bacterium]